LSPIASKLLALVVLSLSLGLQACVSSRAEKQACAVPGHTALTEPPENAEQLYALMVNKGEPRKGLHEHWYRYDENTIELCRHYLPPERGRCGTRDVEFVRRGDVWEIGRPEEVVICSSSPY
jgi:hypothetical protein